MKKEEYQEELVKLYKETIKRGQLELALYMLEATDNLKRKNDKEYKKELKELYEKAVRQENLDLAFYILLKRKNDKFE